MKLLRYGKRCWWKFVFGSPAAFWLFSQYMHLQNSVPEEPVAPFVDDDALPEGQRPLELSDIDLTSWRQLVSEFDAEGVRPPPTYTIYVSRHVAKDIQDGTRFVISPSDLEVPKGYVASEVWVETYFGFDDGMRYGAFTYVGNDYAEDGTDADSGEPFSLPIFQLEVAGLVGRIPIGQTFFSVNDTRVRQTYFRVKVKCTLLQEEYDKWRLEVYGAIMTAYARKKSDYDEQIAAIKVAGGVQIEGRNPELNRQTEREELKKGCITLLTGYRFDAAPMVLRDEREGVEPPDNYPEIQLEATRELAQEIDFFENAFDWKNMTYQFYGPHWGPKDKWLEVYPLTDPDPQFEAFKRAGAVAVMVPATVAYTEALLYFQLTGVIWPGQDVPFFGDDTMDDTLIAPDAEDNRDEEFLLYSSFLAEVHGDQLRDEIDRNVAIEADDPETWVEKIPTSLVWLSPDQELPDYTAEEED